MNDQVAREALTSKQERRFLDFIRGDSHYSRYYDAFYILLNTGLRISEFCGLTVGDIDFERGSVCVSKQLQRSSDMRYYIERPKTSSGVRYVPMSEGVAECFRRVVANRPKPPMDPVKLKYVMGHSDIDVTYNTYTHLGFDDVREDVLRFEEEVA